MNKEDKLIEKKLKSKLHEPKKFLNISDSFFKKVDSEDGRPIVSMKVAGFGNIDSDRDKLHKGSLAQSILNQGYNSNTNRKISFLWQHEITNPIGKSLYEGEREDGGYVRAKMSDFKAVPQSYRAYTQMEEGILNQFSIGFRYDWDRMSYNEDLDYWDIYNIDWREYSVVTAGANEETQYMGILNDYQDLKSWIKVLGENEPERLVALKQFVHEELKSKKQPDQMRKNYLISAVAEHLTNIR